LHGSNRPGFRWIESHAPTSVCDAAEEILNWGGETNAQLAAINRNRLSLDRLKSRCDHPNSFVRDFALKAVAKLDSRCAATKALEILAIATSTADKGFAAGVFALTGTDTQRSDYLEREMRKGFAVPNSFLINLQDAYPGKQLMPALKDYMARPSGNRELALLPLYAWMSKAEGAAFLENTLKNDRALCHSILNQSHFMRAEIWTRTMFILWDHPDATVRQDAFDYGRVFNSGFPLFQDNAIDNALKREVIERLLKMLDTNEKSNAANLISQFLESNVYCFSGEAYPEGIEAARNQAEAWLKRSKAEAPR